jgi:hypothetical protein
MDMLISTLRERKEAWPLNPVLLDVNDEPLVVMVDHNDPVVQVPWWLTPVPIRR